MPCFHPMKGFRNPVTKKWFKNESKHFEGQPDRRVGNTYIPAITPHLKHRNIWVKFEPLTIPCGKCTGCRTEYSRQWAMRIKHEYDWQQELGRNSTFITLTYNDDNLPFLGSLVKKDFQLFMKRLRKSKNSNKQNPIRFYACGEYGDKNYRPHYHAILFNCTFKQDAEIKNKGKDKLYYSQELQDAWSTYDKKTATYTPLGFVSWGSVTFESAQYVAGYVQKKINGKQKYEHYKRNYSISSDGIPYLSKKGQHEFHLQQEFSLMSRKPGIASDWLTKYKSDVYPSDFITINGRKLLPPKYYDRQYEQIDPYTLDEVKKLRKEKSIETQHLRTPEVLEALEQKHKARMSLYSRSKI